MGPSYESTLRLLVDGALAHKETLTQAWSTLNVRVSGSRQYSGRVCILRREDRPLEHCDIRLFLDEGLDVFSSDNSLDADFILGGTPLPPPLDDSSPLIWNRVWSTFASRFGSSLHLMADPPNLVVRRPLLLPHIISCPLLLLHSDWVVIVSDSVSHLSHLPTVLRYAYHNIDYNGQDCNWLCSGVAEALHQLSSRLCLPVLGTEMIWVDANLWLHVDPLAAFLSMIPSSPSLPPPSCRLEEVAEEWRKGRLSNLQYLLFLNGLAGRRRGDPHNHPLLPWVVDFSSREGGWRPLNRSKFRLNKGDDQLREMYKRQPAHHVPELLSDIGYMVYRARRESKEALCRHVRSKWVPREYPSSIRRMYEWTPEECIPELYEDPSLLISIHPDMPDLELPPFVSSPSDFISWHRSQLESEEVSAHLHEWIDLAFGYLLSGSSSVSALNVPLSFVRPPRSGPSPFMSHGTVQLFTSPHPKRLPKDEKVASTRNLLGLNPFYESIRRGEGVRADEEEKKEVGRGQPGSLASLYKEMLSKHYTRFAMRDRCVESVVVLLVEMALPSSCLDLSSPSPFSFRLSRARRLLRDQRGRLPRNMRSSLPRLLAAVSREDGIPSTSRGALLLPPMGSLHLLLLHLLSIPSEVVSLHDRLAPFYAYRSIRRQSLSGCHEGRRQQSLHREVDSLRRTALLSSKRRFLPLHPLLVHCLLDSLSDVESSLPSIARLFPVAIRILDSSSLRVLLPPLRRLLLNESTVKVVDRRLLLQLSISFGARVFLSEFLPTVVEASASRTLDRSIVAKESLLWLARRYGPVVCARHISSNLLRMLASCYENLSLPPSLLSGDILRVPVEGDSTGARVESALGEIALAFSSTFVSMQYVPFCVEVVEGASRRLSAQIEPALVAVLRILRLSMRTMNDGQLMNYLEDFISERILSGLVTMVCSEASSFSSPEVRTLIALRTLAALVEAAARIGPENAKMYMEKPIGRMVETLTGLYEAADNLTLQPRSDAPPALVAAFPLPIVRAAIARLASDWGVPLLASFCSLPACIVPFVTPSSSSSPISIPGAVSRPFSSETPPSSFTRQQYMAPSSAGNRLFSMAGPSLQGPNVGGAGSSEAVGSLTALWSARVSAAVCETASKRVRLDHLSLCSFTGHSSSISSLAVVSNENSFVSGSADKTVRLWSVSADKETTQCQYTYKGHSKAVHDVALLATNAIASTDGVLQLWDPFRGSPLLTAEWQEGISSIGRLANLDRHCILATSSLHSFVKLLDVRAGEWVADLHCTKGAGVARAVAADSSGLRLAVSLSNGSLSLLDLRTGRALASCTGNGTRTTQMKFLSFASPLPSSPSPLLPSSPSPSLIVADTDEPTNMFGVAPRLAFAKKLGEAACCCVVEEEGQLVLTAHSANNIRIYSGPDLSLSLETRLRGEVLSGQISSAARFSLNDAWLFGTSNGTIRLLC